jgi:hypothetical protein
MRSPMQRICHGVVRIAAILLAAHGLALADDQSPMDAAGDNRTTLVDTAEVKVKASLSAMFGGTSYAGTWFGLARPLVDPRFNPQRTWGEGWLQPGLDVVVSPGENVELYGKLSVGLSGTLGTDPYGYLNQGKVWPEAAFAGIRTRPGGDGPVVDFSIGQQPYVVGTGMLVAQGAGNGAERGAVSLMPRVAWANAAIGRLSWHGLRAEAFYLDANEVPSENTGTKLAGGLVEYSWGESARLGAAYIAVIASSDSYPLARAPYVLDDARSGLRSWYGWSRIEGTPVGLPGLWLRLEGATQSNERINLRSYAWYAEVGHRFAEVSLKPTLSFGYGIFSGDNPNTPAIERFDPLFYGNGYDNWWFGVNSALAWLNSNVAYRRMTIQFELTERDVLKLQAVRATAAERFSPLQFNQGIRAVRSGGKLVIVTGVARTHLSDEVSAAWTRQWSPALSTSLWGSAALPGDGLKSVQGVQAKPWYGAGALVTVQY